MNKEQEDIFINYCKEYAGRYKLCVCATTTEKYLHTMAKFKLWRIQEELEDKYKIKFKTTDKEMYELYESTFIKVLSNRIEECKQEQSKKDKVAAKTKNIKRKKD